MLNKKKSRVSFNGIPTLIFGKSLVQIFKRIVQLPVYLVRLNYLALKYAITGQRNIIDRGEASFMGDEFATTRYVAFMHDDKFKSSYEDAFSLVDNKITKSILSTNSRWRAHIVTWAANQAIKVEGDFVECGVWWGVMSKTICNYTNFEKYNDKKFHLIDTWGDPNKENLENKDRYNDDIFHKVKERFKKYPNVNLIRGRVPEILEEVTVKKIAYLAIDMNGHLAERATLERYYDIITPGGIIYFDDYGWGYPKLRKTVDEFFKDKPETLLHFPSGNSIVVKL